MMKPVSGIRTGNPALYCVDNPDDEQNEGPEVTPTHGKVTAAQVNQHQPKLPSATPTPSGPDPSTFDAVKAAQYGAFDRLRQLVEQEGLDVTAKDNEGITLLHWAAINNRKEMLVYLIKKGADVNAVGGELKSSPMHWAVRQGHLGIVVALLQHGADAQIVDVEGCSCIHLAAQFGFTAIIAYLIAKGVEVNTQDKNGMTPLSWCAYRCTNPEPARVLLTLGASTSIPDQVHQNTPLHWACLAKNYSVIGLLVNKANATSNVINAKNQTPLDIVNNHMSEHKKNKKITFLVPKRIIEKMESDLDSKALNAQKGFFQKLRGNPKIRFCAMTTMPFFLFLFAGSIFASEFDYLVKIVLFVFVYMYGNLTGNLFFDERMMTLMPISIYLATKFWFYTVWLIHIRPHVSALTTFTFLFMSAGLWYNFLKTWRGDPGVVKISPEERSRTIIQLAERDGFDHRIFCNTCLLRKPLRSKHCSVCDRCIARFDHHCPWVGNCVGVNNHKYFMGYLSFLCIMCSYLLYGCYSVWLACNSGVEWTNYFSSIKQLAHCEPWVAVIGANVVFHSCWVSTLTVCQYYQVLCLAMTTNERMNAGRYTHFHGHDGGIKSPFNKGFIRNAVDFFGWKCGGFFRPARTEEWFRRYADQDETGDEKQSLLDIV